MRHKILLLAVSLYLTASQAETGPHNTGKAPERGRPVAEGESTPAPGSAEVVEQEVTDELREALDRRFAELMLGQGQRAAPPGTNPTLGGSPFDATPGHTKPVGEWTGIYPGVNPSH